MNHQQELPEGNLPFWFTLRGRTEIKIPSGQPYVSKLNYHKKEYLPLFRPWEPTKANEERYILVVFDVDTLPRGFSDFSDLLAYCVYSYPELCWVRSPSGKVKGFMKTQLPEGVTMDKDLAVQLMRTVDKELASWCDQSPTSFKRVFFNLEMFEAVSKWFHSPDTAIYLVEQEQVEQSQATTAVSSPATGIDYSSEDFGSEWAEVCLEALKPHAVRACLNTRQDPMKLAKAIAFNLLRLMKGNAMLGVDWLANRLDCSHGTASALIKAMIKNGTIEVVHNSYSAQAGRAKVYKAGWKLLQCVKEAGLFEEKQTTKPTNTNDYNPREDYSTDGGNEQLLKDIRVLTARGFPAEYIEELLWEKLVRFQRTYGKLPRSRSNLRQAIFLWLRKKGNYCVA